MPDVAGDRINYRINIDGLSNLDGMKKTIQQLDKLVPGLSKSVDGARTAVGKLNREASNSRIPENIRQETRGFDSLTGAIGRTGSKINWTTIQTTKLSRTMKKAGGTSYFKQQSRDLTGLGNKMKSFGSKATAATAAIVAGAGLAIKTATNLQNRYKVITNLAVTGGEKQAEATRNVAAMQKEGTKYSNEYGISQKNIGQGYETLIRRGYTTNQALGSQKSYLQGAIASGDSYADVVNNAASAIEQFGMKVNSVKGMALASKIAINQMAYSADLTATSFGDLGEALKYAGPDAHAAHQSMHTTVSAIGQLSNAGIEGSQAGTSMRQIYQRLTSPPAKGKAPNAMSKLGMKYSDFRDSKNELLPIQDIFGKLATKMDKMKMSHTDKGAIYAALFGTNASSAAQTLGETYKQVDKLDKKVQKSQNMNHGKGYVATLSKKNMDTFQHQWGRVKNGLVNAGVNIANAWMPSLTKITKSLADILERFQSLPEPTKKFISIGVGIAAVAGPLALVAGSLLKIRGAMASIIKLAGNGSGSKLGLADQVAGFLGVGQGKNNPRKFDTRSGATHFSSRARVPGSLVANGVDWKGIGRTRRTFHAATRNVVSKVRPGRALLSGMDTVKAGRPRLWGMTKSSVSSGLGKVKGGFNFLGKSKLGSVAKFGGKVASQIPILDVAMAGTNLIGMNKKNAGKKVGSAGGMLAGGAIGSLLGPVGGMAGAAIGQALGTKLGATVQKSLPKKLKKSIGSAVKSVQKTFKGLLKPFQSTIKSISKVWSSATRGISKAWKQYVVKPLSGKNGGTAIKDTLKLFKVVLVPTMKIAGTAFKVFGAVVKAAIKVVSHVIEGLIKTISGVFSLISDLIHHRWKNILGDMGQIAGGILETIGKVFMDLFSTILDGLVDLGKNIGKFLAHPIKTVESWFGGGKSQKTGKAPSMPSSQKKLNNIGHKSGSGKSKGINIQTGLAHAAGGLMSTSHMALVGEAGPEMAYHPGQGYMRWLGKNGPTLARVKPGERILNAKDSANVAAGGLGRGMTLPGYASGTAKLVKGKKNKGSVSLKFDAYGASSKASLKSLTKLQKGSKKSWSSMQKDSTKSVKLLSKTNLSEFTGIQKDTGKRTDTIRKNTVSDFDTMQKGSMVQMNQLHKGMNSVTQAMVSDFDKIFGKLSGYAHKEMAAAIKQLNGGIRGINTVLNKFGGGGSVLPLIHYAQGSKGPISKHTMAVVNDAKVGPRQEAIVKPNGRAYLPKGNDVVLPLAPGDEVLNGTETAQLQDVGALPHFAKGTGALRRLIKNSDKDPKKAWRRDFTSNLKDEKSNSLGKGLMATSKGAAKHVGVPWNTEAWAQLKDAMSGGAGAGGNWAHSPGLTKEDGFGTSRAQYYGAGAAHDGVDFSGPLGSAIRAIHGGTVSRIGGVGISDLGKVIIVKSDDGFQEIYQEFGGMGNIKVGVGDTIKTGQRIATLGKLVGTGSGSHVHIGVTKGNPLKKNMLSTSGWYDVTKMHGKSSGIAKPKSKAKNSALSKLVKSELGNRLKWVSNKLAPKDDGGSAGTSSAPSGSHKHWLKQAGIPESWWNATNEIISKESGWNPKASNPSGAYGLPQSLPGSKMASAGSDWRTNPITQLKWYKSYIKSRYGTIGKALAFRHAHNWYANGGWAENGKVNVFGEAKGQNEVAINTSRPSADKFLLEAMSDRAAKDPTGMFGQLKTFAKMQHEFSKMKESQTKFSKQSVTTTQPTKNGMVIRPQITYSPKYVIQGVSDPEAVRKTIAKQETKGQRDFEAKMNNLAAKLMSAE